MIEAMKLQMRVKGISQRKLSETSGVSRAHIFRFLRGYHNHTSFWVVGALSGALGLDPAEMAALHFSSVQIAPKGRRASAARSAAERPD